MTPQSRLELHETTYTLSCRIKSIVFVFFPLRDRMQTYRARVNLIVPPLPTLRFLFHACLLLHQTCQAGSLPPPKPPSPFDVYLLVDDLFTFPLFIFLCFFLLEFNGFDCFFSLVASLYHSSLHTMSVERAIDISAIIATGRYRCIPIATDSMLCRTAPIPIQVASHSLPLPPPRPRIHNRWMSFVKLVSSPSYLLSASHGVLRKQIFNPIGLWNLGNQGSEARV